MSILINGMEMPKSCDKCPCGSVYFGYKCMAKQKKFEKYPLDSRQDWCPLVPVPPHGRLIDADALVKSDRMVGKLMMYGGEYVYTQEEIDRAPTIIPAEEGET